MSGFAVSIKPDVPANAEDDSFKRFVGLVASFKGLEPPAEFAVGRHCWGAKLDSPATRHRGITRDKTTGSWLLAVGTVFDTTADGSTDTRLDALLQSYLETGPDALQNYDGHFGLVIYNALEESLSVISDPCGYFSVYYARSDGQILISTSALALAKQVHSPPDPMGVECYLRTERYYGEMTLWRDVRRVLPATVVKFVDGRVQQTQYWQPTVDEQVERLSLADATAYTFDVFDRAIERSLRREGKIWTDLTGGFDTRLLVMFLARLNIPFVANCTSAAGSYDAEISSTIAQELGWEYQLFTLPETWGEEQWAWFEPALLKGDANFTVLHMAQVLWGHELKSHDLSVLVQGTGGEILRGTLWWQELMSIGKSPEVNYDLLLDSRLLKSLDSSILMVDHDQEVRHHLRTTFERIGNRYAGLPNTVKLDAIRTFRSKAYSGAYMSATAGYLRALIPYYFTEPLNCAFSINYKWRDPRSYRLVRHLMEQGNPRLANILTTDGGPATPMRLTNLHRFSVHWMGKVNLVVKGASRRFLGRRISLWSPRPRPGYPWSSWRQSLVRFAKSEGLLNPPSMRSGGLYEPERLRDFVARAEAEGFEHHDFLARMVTLEMALRTVGADIDSAISSI